MSAETASAALSPDEESLEAPGPSAGEPGGDLSDDDDQEYLSLRRASEEGDVWRVLNVLLGEDAHLRLEAARELASLSRERPEVITEQVAERVAWGLERLVSSFGGPSPDFLRDTLAALPLAATAPLLKVWLTDLKYERGPFRGVKHMQKCAEHALLVIQEFPAADLPQYLIDALREALFHGLWCVRRLAVRVVGKDLHTYGVVREVAEVLEKDDEKQAVRLEAAAVLARAATGAAWCGPERARLDAVLLMLPGHEVTVREKLVESLLKHEPPLRDLLPYLATCLRDPQTRPRALQLLLLVPRAASLRDQRVVEALRDPGFVEALLHRGAASEEGDALAAAGVLEAAFGFGVWPPPAAIRAMLIHPLPAVRARFLRLAGPPQSWEDYLCLWDPLPDVVEAAVQRLGLGPSPAAENLDPTVVQRMLAIVRAPDRFSEGCRLSALELVPVEALSDDSLLCEALDQVVKRKDCVAGRLLASCTRFSDGVRLRVVSQLRSGSAELVVALRRFPARVFFTEETAGAVLGGLRKRPLAAFQASALATLSCFPEEVLRAAGFGRVLGEVVPTLLRVADGSLEDPNTTVAELTLDALSCAPACFLQRHLVLAVAETFLTGFLARYPSNPIVSSCLRRLNHLQVFLEETRDTLVVRSVGTSLLKLLPPEGEEEEDAVTLCLRLLKRVPEFFLATTALRRQVAQLLVGSLDPSKRCGVSKAVILKAVASLLPSVRDPLLREESSFWEAVVRLLRSREGDLPEVLWALRRVLLRGGPGGLRMSARARLQASRLVYHRWHKVRAEALAVCTTAAAARGDGRAP